MESSQEYFTKFAYHHDQQMELTRNHLLSLESRLISRPLMLAVDPEKTDSDSFSMDMSLQYAAPVAIVPTHSEFFPLQENGHRFLLASDGLYLEVRRPWLYFVHRIAVQTAVAMPYGSIEARTDLAFGRLGNLLGFFRQFAVNAQEHAPNEFGELLVWDANERSLRDGYTTILDASPGSLKYECRPLQEHEIVAIDLHSHGALPAFFSPTDNQDDAGSVKISGVLGGFGTDAPSTAFRLCVLGLYLPINVPVEAIFGGA